MKTIFKIISTGILILLLATLVVPAGYLAWRAGQPMALPQYNGLTYYQFMRWQKIAYHKLAVDYKAAHPNNPMHGGLDMCFNVALGMDLSTRLPVSGIETLAGVFPGLKKVVTPRDWVNIPQEVTVQTFLPIWWGIFEKLVWSEAEYNPNTSVVYCRLKPDVPTLEKLKILQSSYRQAVTP